MAAGAAVAAIVVAAAGAAGVPRDMSYAQMPVPAPIPADNTTPLAAIATRLRTAFMDASPFANSPGGFVVAPDPERLL